MEVIKIGVHIVKHVGTTMGNIYQAGLQHGEERITDKDLWRLWYVWELEGGMI